MEDLKVRNGAVRALLRLGARALYLGAMGSAMAKW
jgi:hypothetical protein